MSIWTTVLTSKQASRGEFERLDTLTDFYQYPPGHNVSGRFVVVPLQMDSWKGEADASSIATARLYRLG